MELLLYLWRYDFRAGRPSALRTRGRPEKSVVLAKAPQNGLAERVVESLDPSGETVLIPSRSSASSVFVTCPALTYNIITKFARTYRWQKTRRLRVKPRGQGACSPSQS
jgi:hypothetical protein